MFRVRWIGKYRAIDENYIADLLEIYDAVAAGLNRASVEINDMGYFFLFDKVSAGSRIALQEEIV